MSDDLVDRIAAIRVKNNTTWMQLLKIALREAPEETRDVLREIQAYDAQVRALTRELAGLPPESVSSSLVYKIADDIASMRRLVNVATRATENIEAGFAKVLKDLGKK